MIAPSSNTVLEPMTAALLLETLHISAHAARIRVISMGGGSVAQFDTAPMLGALALLEVSGFGLVTPYVVGVRARVRENFRAAGFACVAEWTS